MRKKMITAYILINTRVGKEYSVINSLKKINEKVKLETKALFGDYDAIVILKAENLEKIDHVVTSLRKNPDVIKTTTLIAT